MNDATTRDDATTRELLARLAEQEIRLRALAGEVARSRRGRARPRRLLPLALVALLVALVPLSLLAADPIFVDLGQAGEVHRADIQAIGNAGITTGFDDPTAEDPTYRLYDPTGLVTREQMASFLARTAGLGANPPVANARTAQTAAHATSADNATNATSATSATSAGNANTVGGYAPNALVRAASAQQGAAITLSTITSAPVVSVQITTPGPGYILVIASCDITITGGGNAFARVWVRDATAGTDSPVLLTDVTQGSGTYKEAFTPTYLFPVGSSGARTYSLMFSVNGIGVSLQAANGAITVLFVPFGPTGSVSGLS